MKEQPKKKCLFLFTELAGYILACMKHLAANCDVVVHVVKWPINAVAPFQFSFEGDNIHFYERKEFSDIELLELAKKINPDIILCSGWQDSGYKNICKFYKGKIHTILGLDNPWRNTLKQNIAAVIGPLYLHSYFSHCWVPGKSQKKYASKLGFRNESIKTGAYSCDYPIFHQQYLNNKTEKEKHFPKKIIFVGRYTQLKGVDELWRAFIRFQNEQPSEWELWCLGKGELESNFPKHEKIKNFGFVQPTEMKKFVADCGVFILPSHYEHWGVVVHEFAASGFPIISTTTTGATEMFLKDGENGFLMDPQNEDSILRIFKQIATMPSSELLKMGDKSAELSGQITPATWSATFMEFFKSK
jgi:glycosyltransferase involved in cell wall biosynthesis